MNILFHGGICLSFFYIFLMFAFLIALQWWTQHHRPSVVQCPTELLLRNPWFHFWLCHRQVGQVTSFCASVSPSISCVADLLKLKTLQSKDYPCVCIAPSTMESQLHLEPLVTNAVVPKLFTLCPPYPCHAPSGQGWDHSSRMGRCGQR